MMEQGAYSLAAHQFGYSNNSTLAYIFYYLFFFIISFQITKRLNFTLPKNNNLGVNFKTLSISTLIVSIFFLILILFIFGGYQVLLGKVDKSSFRVGLGFFGSIAYLTTKLFLPTLLVLNAFYFRKTEKTNLNKVLLVLNFVLAFLFGMSWGFKSTAIFILIPAFIVLFPQPKFIKVLLFSAVSFIFFVLFSMYFDGAQELSTKEIDLFSEVVQENPIEAIIYRSTVLQGDPCWKIWDMYSSGELKHVEYSKTLYSVIGDGNLNRFFGVNQENYPEFINFHFGLLLTFLVGNEPYVIQQGYNVTGTVFSEGIIAGGILGIILFSLFAGFLSSLFSNIISTSFKNNLPVLCSISSTYFTFYIFTWLNGGGVENLFHISILVGLIFDSLIVITILTISKKIKL